MTQRDEFVIKAGGTGGAKGAIFSLNFLADQLTLFQPVQWQIMPAKLLLAPQNILTCRPCQRIIWISKQAWLSDK